MNGGVTNVPSLGWKKLVIDSPTGMTNAPT
jgi:hypothetical protein